VARNDAGYIRRDDASFRHFANSELCRYFPGGSGADEHIIAVGGNGIASDRGQCRIAKQPPEERTRVQ